MIKRCFQCGALNSEEQLYCGTCGTVLALGDFVALKTGEAVRDVVKDRDVLETESAIKVFERAWGWVKIVGGITAACLAVLSFGAFWTFKDFRSTVEVAKKSVAEDSRAARDQIGEESTKAAGEIQAASRSANRAGQTATESAKELSKKLNSSVGATRAELLQEGLAVRKEVTRSRLELAEINKLEPQFNAMRLQLGHATEDIAEQQHMLSNSEEFVKKVFSSHSVESFLLDQNVKSRSIVLPPSSGKGNTIVYLLLPTSPIDGTLQLQYNIFVQPPGSFFNIHNLVIFIWGDPVEGLRTKQLSVSYFPDKSDKELIRSLSMHSDRVYADDQPLPKLGQIDSDFQGNKWTPLLGTEPK